MAKPSASCPLTETQILDRYFIEHRAKLIDLAAFLDRLDRSAHEPPEQRQRGFVVDAFRSALEVLVDGRGQRAQRTLEVLSDPTLEPLESAAGLKGAYGAYPLTTPKQRGDA